MSLTSYLKDPQSAVSRFMRTQFPNVRPMQSQFRSALADKPVNVPSVPVPWRVIGQAFDYRLRYYFSVTPGENLVAYSGMLRVSEGSSGLRIGSTAVEVMSEPRWPDLGQSFVGSLSQTVNRINPAQRRLMPEDERAINRYCIVLAFFEDIFRSGFVGAPLDQLPQNALAEDALALVESVWVDDLCALSYMFYDAHGELTAHPAILNPVFSGSRDVGGADSDLIVDRCLIDVKTTKNPSLDANWLYQVIGYALLDYDDEYHVQDIGFYLSRQGALISWPLDGVLTTIAGGRSQKLADLRKGFKNEIRVGRGKH